MNIVKLYRLELRALRCVEIFVERHTALTYTALTVGFFAALGYNIANGPTF